MQELEDPVGDTEAIEVREDLDRYLQLIVASDRTWWDFWLLGLMCLVGGVGVLAFSGEIWAIAVSALVFIGLFLRTARIINRLDGELAFLHRKWVRRGRFFSTDGRTAEALQYHPE